MIQILKNVIKKYYIKKVLSGNKYGSGIEFTIPLTVKSSILGNYIVLGKGVNIYNSRLDDYSKVMSGSYIINSFLGEYSYVAVSSILQRVKIAKYSSIASNVIIGSTQHPLEYISTHPFLYYKKYGEYIQNDRKEFLNKIESGYVEVGNDVWIGNGVIILSSVKIGDGAIIGAGSVVTRDIPPYAVCVGVPSKIIRYRFNENQIATLLNLKWWDWPRERIIDNLDLFLKPNDFLNNFHFDRK